MCRKCQGRLQVNEDVPLGEVMTADVREFLKTFVFYQEHGTMPEAGGLLDQSTTWVDAAAIMIRRIAENQGEDRERDRKDRARKDREEAARQGRHHGRR